MDASEARKVLDGLDDKHPVKLEVLKPGSSGSSSSTSHYPTSQVDSSPVYDR